MLSNKNLKINLWWHQVTVTLEDSNKTVFKSGTLKVSKNSNLIGGHIKPHKISTHKELLKNLQKNLEKNIASEKINISILDLNLSITSVVCKPKNVDSQTISRHHI